VAGGEGKKSAATAMMATLRKCNHRRVMVACRPFQSNLILERWGLNETVRTENISEFSFLQPAEIFFFFFFYHHIFRSRKSRGFGVISAFQTILILLHSMVSDNWNR
jgi:hypothetical protein